MPNSSCFDTCLPLTPEPPIHRPASCVLFSVRRLLLVWHTLLILAFLSWLVRSLTFCSQLHFVHKKWTFLFLSPSNCLYLVSHLLLACTITSDAPPRLDCYLQAGLRAVPSALCPSTSVLAQPLPSLTPSACQSQCCALFALLRRSPMRVGLYSFLADLVDG